MALEFFMVVLDNRFKDGQLILPGNENMTSYTVSSVGVEDSGYYYCTASNEYSSVTSQVSSLRVEGNNISFL